MSLSIAAEPFAQRSGALWATLAETSEWFSRPAAGIWFAA